MRAALATKLRCAGPPGGFQGELQRFLPWLPPHLRPLVVSLRRWQRRYAEAGDVELRLALERQALDDLGRRLLRLPEGPLLQAFAAQLRRAHAASLEARRTALAGKPVDPEQERRAFLALRAWLAARSDHRELCGWLARMLTAWWVERHPADDAGDERPGAAHR